jgi:anaerobic nitric oxide reductase transcription regulator
MRKPMSQRGVIAKRVLSTQIKDGRDDRDRVTLTMDESLLLSDLTVLLPAAVRLQRLVTALRAQFGCEAVALLALEPGGIECLRPLASAGLVRDALGRRFLLAEHPRLAAIMAVRDVVAFDAGTRWPDPYDGLVEGQHGLPLPVHDCMGIRLQQDGRPWGALTLDGLTPGRFGERERDMLARLAPMVEVAVRVSRLERENHDLRHARAFAARTREDQVALGLATDEDWEIVAHSEAMRGLLEESQVVARSGLPVLLLGETGVGKELFARRLHRLSGRHDKPLVQVNCAALPETLAESELFGHVRGAFSGASTERAGRVEAAQGGTLLLDEVGELPLALQAKLLRTLQDGEIQRLGSDRTRKVDVRVIAATNRDLRAAVRDGHFRADLYHRLSVYPLPIPPLRERRDDILPLAGRFLEINRARLGLRGLRLARSAERALLDYDWPGNVRELEHVIGRAALRAASGSEGRHRIVSIGPPLLGIELADAPHAVKAAASPDPALAELDDAAALAPRVAAQAAQRHSIRVALNTSAGNWARAARQLGVDPSNLHKMARRLGMK